MFTSFWPKTLTLKDFAEALVVAIIGTITFALFDAVLGVLIALVLVLGHIFFPMGEGRPVAGGQGWLGGSCFWRSSRNSHCICC